MVVEGAAVVVVEVEAVVALEDEAADQFAIGSWRIAFDRGAHMPVASVGWETTCITWLSAVP